MVMMTDYFLITGERVIATDAFMRVSLSARLRVYTGNLVYLHHIAETGQPVRRGDAVVVVEGYLGAVELYAPCDGQLHWVDEMLTSPFGWLFTIRRAE